MPNESFNGSLKRLEEITKALEKGDCELEEAMKLFEEGVALSSNCSKTLETAKQKVTLLANNN